VATINADETRTDHQSVRAPELHDDIVAEENAVKARALMRTVLGPTPVVQSIGRASLKPVDTVGLSAGEYKKAQNC
jgi:hypothetical protein